MEPCIYIDFLKKLLSYHFIDLYHILNWSNSEQEKNIKL